MQRLIILTFFIFISYFSFLISHLPTASAQTSWTADNGNGTFTNPLFYDEFSDPDVIRVGDDARFGHPALQGPCKLGEYLVLF